MSASRAAGAGGRRQVARESAFRHEGFLRYRRFRWAKLASLFAIVAIAVYAWHDPDPRPNGGTWYGYVLGTIGALLILWLTALGMRKRVMTRGAWSLKAWTSAHVYLGLSLIVIGTLHAGFQFGWNVHTLAYALMMLVILSGLFGIVVYATLPRLLSQNRGELTETQMLENLRSLDRQLHDAAQPLPPAQAELVARALAEDVFAGGFWTRFSAGERRGATAAARSAIRGGDDATLRVERLLERKLEIGRQIHRHLRLRALLEIWLYVHIPMTIALLAALTAHVVSVFFYW